MANIVLGVCGGIAAYKAASIISGLQKTGNSVKVIATQCALEKMVSAPVLSALSGGQLYTDKSWFDSEEGKVIHIDLAEWANVFLIAPATASTIGKIAHGICDNLLVTTACALPEKTRKVFAPAMNSNMLNNRAVVRNMEILKEDGWELIPPSFGVMACGAEGPGILPRPRNIVSHINKKEV